MRIAAVRRSVACGQCSTTKGDGRQARGQGYFLDSLLSSNGDKQHGSVVGKGTSGGTDICRKVVKISAKLMGTKLVR
jgi:hypothetical protein